LVYWHKLPRASAAKGLGTGRPDDHVVFTGTAIRGRWAFDVYAGVLFLGRPEGRGRVRQGVASAALTCALDERWNLTLDTYALAATEGNPRVVSSILAVSWVLREGLVLDAALEKGLTSDAPRWGVNLGLVWRLGRLW